ncbi:potassium-transporting ATPase subunit KdpC [Candidatus Merdisoma sp. HCP28S3_D10]|uniref:potassium-transporting ATPase subunit KdpC n=1 Tax=unclassified Candidatus Merdisoma TaxID=3099611 RepID=UPI003F8C59E9
MDDFLAEATPEGKLAMIRDFQAKGHLVAMTGDGTNDAPALEQADVAVAMNSGTQAAKEAGNMVDLDSSPTKLIDIVRIGKQLLMTRGRLTTFTLLCGVIYTGVVTGIAQLIFSDNANGSIIEVDGKKYGCELLGQQYTDESHMWGRVMNIDVSTYTDENGKELMYAAPSNISPASEEYAQLVAERVEKLRAADPDMDETAVPVDLVTCSGSGLDPHISPAAAEYQVARIAKANDMTDDEVRKIIRKYTDGRFLGIFGEETVNVLEVNLMLDGILDE